MKLGGKLAEVYYTAAEARKVLGLDDDAFQYWCRKGTITRTYLPKRKHPVYSREEIDAIVAQIMAGEEPEMSTQPPRLEARISSQERQMTMLQARVEELGQDVADSFKQLADYQIASERKIDARFDRIENQITAIQSNMTEMEERILDAFKQLVMMIDTRLPPSTESK